MMHVYVMIQVTFFPLLLGVVSLGVGVDPTKLTISAYLIHITSQ